MGVWKFVRSSLFSLPLHQMTENQVRDRARELEELQEAVRKHGGAREDQPELEAEQQAVQREFQQLLTPLDQRRGKLEASKAVHQFYRDLADELVRINHRTNSLFKHPAVIK